MKYTGTFKSIKEHTIKVTIIPQGSESETAQDVLKFSGNNPVVISQVSDGLFSPIKSRTCTVSLVTDEPLLDLYTTSPKGVKLIVDDLDDVIRLFVGYITPFKYNQQYINLDTLEIEAIDSISTLKDIKYKLVSDVYGSTVNGAQFLDVAYVLYKALVEEAGYTHLYVPKESVTSSKPVYLSSLEVPAFVGEKISESAFYDKEGELMSYYEIIEEICRFYCLSCIPMDDKIFFVDYRLSRYYDIANPNSETIHGVVNPFRDFADLEGLPYNVVSGKYYGIDWTDLTQQDIDNDLNYTQFWIPNSGIIKDSYTGSNQTLEIEEVYNKFGIKPTIEEYKLNINPTSDFGIGSYNQTIIDSFSYYVNGVAQSSYIGYVGINELLFGMNNNNTYKTNVFTNVSASLFGYFLSDSFNHQENSLTNARTNFDIQYSYGTGVFNKIVGQTALLVKYTVQKQLVDGLAEAKPEWKDVIAIPTQAYYLAKYYADQDIVYSPTPGSLYIGNPDLPDYYNMIKLRNWPAMGIEDWYNSFYLDHMGGNNVVLEYVSDDCLDFSPHSLNTNEDIKNYILIKGDILYQHNTTDSNDVGYNLWSINSNNINGMLFPITELGYSGYDDVSTYTSGHKNLQGNVISNSNYKTTYGWQFFKISLKIGDFYYDGSTWNTTESTFFLPIAKTENGERKLVFGDWMSIQRNFDYKYCIEDAEDAFAIQVPNYIKGKMNIKVYMPKIPFHGQIWSWGARFKHYGISGEDNIERNTFKVDYTKCPPAILIKNFEVLHRVAKNSTYTENGVQVGFVKNYRESTENDLVYSHTVNTDYINDMGDIEMQFNTYNAKKAGLRPNLIHGCKDNHSPVADDKSYTSFYDPIVKTNNGTPKYQRQELNVLDRYVEHYSTPKVIYNCQIHDYQHPFQCFEVTAIPNKRFVLDSQEWDVKSDVNNIKLIEY